MVNVESKPNSEVLEAQLRRAEDDVFILGKEQLRESLCGIKLPERVIDQLNKQVKLAGDRVKEALIEYLESK